MTDTASLPDWFDEERFTKEYLHKYYRSLDAYHIFAFTQPEENEDGSYHGFYAIDDSEPICVLVLEECEYRFSTSIERLKALAVILGIEL